MNDNPDLRNTGQNPAVVVGDDAVPQRVSPAQEWVEVRVGDGTERPDELPWTSGSMYVSRTFCFADLSGFTGYTRRYGPPEAVRLLGEFRTVTRRVATARGVRVAKWLGDGVMIVGVEPSPTIALAAHMIDHFARTDVEVRVGIATGLALLFEGDDYIGEPVNLAAKLCAAAQPREILADTKPEDLPEWVTEGENIEVDIRGLGRIGGIHRLLPALDRRGREGFDIPDACVAE